MENQIREYVTSLIRTLLTPIIGWLAVNGYISESQSTQLAVIVASIVVTYGWSALNKYLWKRKVETALELPAGSSVEKLKDVLARK